MNEGLRLALYNGEARRELIVQNFIAENEPDERAPFFFSVVLLICILVLYPSRARAHHCLVFPVVRTVDIACK